MTDAGFEIWTFFMAMALGEGILAGCRRCQEINGFVLWGFFARNHSIANGGIRWMSWR